jgi:putative peptidoglycan lipid II flippase
MIFSNKIIELLYGRGAFENNSVLLTSGALRFYSVGLIGMALREVVSRGFYALEDSITPVKNAVIAVCLNVILNIVLSKYLGINGVALATSIAASFTTILLFISLRKKIGPFGMKQISISFLKILFASSLMGGLAKLSFNYLTISLSQNLSLLIAIGVGALSYFVIIYFMKIEDVDVIVGAIKKKLGRGAA